MKEILTIALGLCLTFCCIQTTSAQETTRTVTLENLNNLSISVPTNFKVEEQFGKHLFYDQNNNQYFKIFEPKTYNSNPEVKQKLKCNVSLDYLTEVLEHKIGIEFLYKYQAENGVGIAFRREDWEVDQVEYQFYLQHEDLCVRIYSEPKRLLSNLEEDLSYIESIQFKGQTNKLVFEEVFVSEQIVDGKFKKYDPFDFSHLIPKLRDLETIKEQLAASKPMTAKELCGKTWNVKESVVFVDNENIKDVIFIDSKMQTGEAYTFFEDGTLKIDGFLEMSGKWELRENGKELCIRTNISKKEKVYQLLRQEDRFEWFVLESRTIDYMHFKTP